MKMLLSLVYRIEKRQSLISGLRIRNTRYSEGLIRFNTYQYFITRGHCGGVMKTFSGVMKKFDINSGINYAIIIGIA